MFQKILTGGASGLIRHGSVIEFAVCPERARVRLNIGMTLLLNGFTKFSLHL